MLEWVTKLEKDVSCAGAALSPNTCMVKPTAVPKQVELLEQLYVPDLSLLTSGAPNREGGAL